MAVFRRFLHLARPLQIPWHGAGWSGGQLQGRYKMSISYANLHSVALSIVGALVASSLFLSAAVSSAPII
jgi:hypothetical protein